VHGLSAHFDQQRLPICPSQKEEVPPYYGDYTPDHKVIYKFVKTLFHAAQVRAPTFPT